MKYGKRILWVLICILVVGGSVILWQNSKVEESGSGDKAEGIVDQKDAEGEKDEDAGEAALEEEGAEESPSSDDQKEGEKDMTLPLSDPKNEGNWEVFEPMTDEFEGDSLDPEKWWAYNPQWKGRQPGYFYPGNVSVSDGKLHLTMKAEEVPEMPKEEGYHTYTCAAVKSKVKVLYGYFEVKAKPMRSAGSSAFWFYDSTPEWWTEIDVFEIGGGAPGFERKYNMNLHVFRTPEEDRHWDKPKIWDAPWDLADDYHVYGLEWDEDFIKFYVDGLLVRRDVNTHWHQPLYMNFDSETMPDWFGLPDIEDLPSTYSIEYVRAWKKKEN